jgi:hypothetical protein
MSFFKKAPAPGVVKQVVELVKTGLALGVMMGVAKTTSHNVDRLIGKLPILESEAAFQQRLAEIKAGGKQP